MFLTVHENDLNLILCNQPRPGNLSLIFANLLYDLGDFGKFVWHGFTRWVGQ